jgi:hypothetical protein
MEHLEIVRMIRMDVEDHANVVLRSDVRGLMFVRPISRGAVCPDEPPKRQINPERAASRVASHRSRQTERRHASVRLACKIVA